MAPVATWSQRMWAMIACWSISTFLTIPIVPTTRNGPARSHLPKTVTRCLYGLGRITSKRLEASTLPSLEHESPDRKPGLAVSEFNLNAGIQGRPVGRPCFYLLYLRIGGSNVTALLARSRCLSMRGTKRRVGSLLGSALAPDSKIGVG